MDIKAAVDGAISVIADLGRMLPGVNGALAFGAACLLALMVLNRSAIGTRAKRGLEDTLFSNWQLALLGATGIILSLASGYTTWDGMRNFTGEAVLSGMVTFGIQGVMLIVAWLIGESFATGMSQVSQNGQVRRSADGKVGMILGLLLVGVTFYALARTFGGLSTFGQITDATKFSNVAMYFAFGLLVLAILVLALRGDKDLTMPYIQSTRVVIKSAVLWVMFLACMATSVFFSFDSLFSAIFPQGERQRAAEIRSVNQVAAVVADIGELTEKRRIEQAQALFTLPAWATYEAELDKAARLASEAPDKIRAEMTRELEAQKSRIAKLEEQKASATSNQAGLVTRKQLLTDNVSRLESERPEAAQKVAEQKAVVSDAEKRLDEARAKVMAEEKGVEGSGKVGRGQFYRAAKGDEEKIQSELQVARERLKGHEIRLNTVARGISVAKAELAQIDGSLANLKGEAETAGQMIAVAQSGAKKDISEKLDPSAMASALERDRQQFRQKPEQKTLISLQNDCMALQDISLKVASLRDAASAIDCDPKQANEAASRVFALNTGIENFAAACAGGDKLADKKTTDDLLGFGRKCLQDSGLPSKDTAEIAGRLSAIDLSRDDKAHRFVVTLNAFQDGNRLAYLALAIAIAIDSLVFMSGLFGANAVRSPLSDVPSYKARSASQLEGIIRSALGADKVGTANAALALMRPVRRHIPAEVLRGCTNEITLDASDHDRDLIKLLNAGALIGAVTQDSENHYFIRPELVEFLAHFVDKADEGAVSNANAKRLENDLIGALQPKVFENIRVVQNAFIPIELHNGFSAMVDFKRLEGSSSIPGSDSRVLNLLRHNERANAPVQAPKDNFEANYVVRSVLNVGATHGKVQRVGRKDPTKFYVHYDMVRALANIRSRAKGQEDSSGAAEFRNQVRHAGTMHDYRTPLSSEQAPQIAAPPPLPTEEDLRRHDFENLLQAIGVQPETFYAMQEGSAGAAIAAMAAFKGIRARNKQLDQYIDDREAPAKQEVFEAYSTMRASIRDDDEHRIEILNAAYEDIESNWSLLMLMPDGRYESTIDELISKLESPAGAGRLSPSERDMHRLLKTLKNQLVGSDRSTAEDWQRLARNFQNDVNVEPDGNLAMFEQRRQHR